MAGADPRIKSGDGHDAVELVMLDQLKRSDFATLALDLSPQGEARAILVSRSRISAALRPG
jgi:hypothetical protein